MALEILIRCLTGLRHIVVLTDACGMLDSQEWDKNGAYSPWVGGDPMVADA